MNWKQFLTEKGLSEADFAAKEPAEMAKLQTEFTNKQTEISTKLIEDLKGEIAKASTPEQVTKLINDSQETFKTQISDLEGEIVALKEKGTPTGEENPILEAIIAAKEEIKKSIDNKGHQAEFVVKANTTRASVANSTDALRLQEVGQLAHRAFILRGLFSVIPVGSGSNGVVRYSDWDQASITRAAAMVAEGAVFPESTAAWAEYTLDLKKIGDSIPVTEEMVQDAPRFARELEDFLNVNVSIEEDDQLYSGDGTGNNLNGIITSAPTYTPVASGITDANFYDLIVKTSESITKGKRSKNQPNFGLMNITDINRMKLSKDSNNNYIIPPFVSRDGNQVAGITIIETNVVVANTMVMGDSRFAKIYEVEGYNVTTGLVNDQFTKDLMTLKAKKRMNLLIREADKSAFAKITDIDAALVLLAT